MKAVKILGAMLALSAIAAPQQSASQTRVAIKHDITNVRPTSEKNLIGDGHSNANPYRHNWGVKNQRQYRKLCRQVPNIRKSKKFRK